MEKYDLISRKEAKRAIKIRCILNHIPFKSDTPEGQRALEALEAVRNAPSIDVEPYFNIVYSCYVFFPAYKLSQK